MTRFLFSMLIVTSAGLMAWAVAILCQSPSGLHPARFQAWIHRIDLNGDQEIDSLEYRQVAGGGPDISVYDLNSDGRLDVSEFELGMRWVDPLWMYEDPK